MTPSPASPIGVFDSGVGGLTVVREILSRLPAEPIVYFGDTARVPYGPKSPDIVRRYAREAAAFLLSRGVKAIVVACNTATAAAADTLAAELDVPVLGVIEPGARAAVAATRTGRIGVIGTVGTIRSGAYDHALRRRLPEARVYAQPCPLLVPLAEEGLVDGDAARLIAEGYLDPLRALDIDVLVLGCTHYPLLRPLIARIMGPAVALVDPGAETAAELHGVLERRGLLRGAATPPAHLFVASDAPLRFRELAGRFLGRPVTEVERVDVEGFDRAA
ncbi:MAG: glutamate racemase [Gemmatimonadetes bacterium]|nr:glutamate racemase [Gemmatimonadota bacterium]